MVLGTAIRTEGKPREGWCGDVSAWSDPNPFVKDLATVHSASTERISANLDRMGRRLQLDQLNPDSRSVHLKISSIAEVAHRCDRSFSGCVSWDDVLQ